MNLFETFRAQLVTIVGEMIAAKALPTDLNLDRITVEPPRDASHGDLTTNAAMVLAGPAGLKPRELAAKIAEQLQTLPSVMKVEVAGPGFVNFELSVAFWHDQMRDILDQGVAFGDSRIGQGKKVNVEYVSANPTGPLHVAHARGAVTGDALALLLRKAGYDVTTEYYINDAGSQVDTLARSAYLRYREALGETIGEIPEGLYPGDYLIDVGKALAARDGDQWLILEEDQWLAEFRKFSVAAMMDLVRDDLQCLGVVQDVFTSEKALVDAGAVDDVLQTLSDKGLIYIGALEPPKGMKPDDWEPRPQTLFKATEFGDDTDRPLRKSDGSWTYFANDIAYHLDKYRRGFNLMIDVFGADHGGYVKRMKAATTAISGGEAELEIKLCQMVHLMKGGEPMRMSKRSGNFVTLRELIDEVGKDVVRFIMLTRSSDSQMEFDLQKVLEQSRDNPVFYVQYAHARCRSVLRNAQEALSVADLEPSHLAKVPLARIDDPAELELIRIMANWPRTVEAAATAQEPHRIAYYLNDLATQFHGLWNMGKDDARLRFIHSDDRELTLARLALVQAVALVIASGLAVFGVSPMEELR
ncbi:MAG: arginine--tRNA ligase [Rhodospirillales bacterium]|nr:arginine--tRNA ligase [Rhodospirillales bacterium]